MQELPSESNWALATVDRDGTPTGCLEAGGAFYPLASVPGLSGASTVAGLFHDWDAALRALTEALPRLKPADAIHPGRRLAPLLYPGKILCAGANYYDHLAEMGMPDAKKADQRLFFFMKPPRNAVVGEGDDRAYADRHQRLRLGGGTGRWSSARRARNVVRGGCPVPCRGTWTVAVDFSARDHNRAPETFYKLDWVAGKANDTCCPMGPRLVPFARLADPQDAGLRLSVNGERKQDGRTTDMIFSVAEQIATASRIMTLDPGDVVLTGTPAGVGAPKGTFLSVGDVVTAEIDGIGSLSVTIQPEG